MNQLKFGLLGILLFSVSTFAAVDCSLTSYPGGAAEKGESGSGKRVELSNSGFDFVAQDSGKGRLNMWAYENGKPIAGFDGTVEKGKVQSLSVMTGRKSDMIRMHCIQ
ncbi:MAG: hypothetical protein KA715_03420 [Xanthomonadaceae bacterium]|nr:hypothetical protein [Xanthomonadaceae bacterium]